MTSNPKSSSIFLSGAEAVYMSLLTAVWLIYAYLSFQTPAPNTLMRYHITLTQLKFLRISVMLPMLVIWFAILYATLKVWHYSKTIQESLDGHGFALLARGFFIFLVASVASSFLSLIIQLNSNPVATMNASTLRIFNTYLNIILNFIGYLFIFLGSGKFITLTKTELMRKKNNRYGYAIVALAAAIYAILLFNNPLRTVSPNPLSPPTYGVSDPLIVTTIMLPTIVTWLFGVLAISNLMIFRQNTKGIIYKKALKNFYIGFILVVSLVIVLSFLTQFSAFWASTGIKEILVLVYVILGIIIFGYLYIASGSYQLEQIETA